MADYSFTTIWRLDAPVERVWDSLRDVERWPEWWRGVESVTLLREGNEQGIGAVHRYTWKSWLPYRLVFDMETTHVEPLQRMEGRAEGELAGTGCWTFEQADDITTVRYDWNVRTTQRWMNVIAPVARPFFAWNHDVVMGWGGEGLAALLGARLLSSDEG